MWAMSAFGGIGGDTGRSMGWAVVMAPYPVGWLMGIVGGILTMISAFKRTTAAV